MDYLDLSNFPKEPTIKYCFADQERDMKVSKEFQEDPAWINIHLVLSMIRMIPELGAILCQEGTEHGKTTLKTTTGVTMTSGQVP